MFSTTTAVGRLTKDPVIKAYQSGTGELALFSLAINNNKDKADFYDCVAFGKTAEMIKNYLSNGKGRLIGVEGYFQTNNSERDINGTKVTNYGMNLVVNRVHFLDSPTQAQGGQQGGQQQQQRQAAPQQQAPAYGQQQQQQQQQYQQQPVQQQPQQGYGQQQAPQADPFPAQSNSGFGGFPGFISDDDLPF